ERAHLRRAIAAGRPDTAAEQHKFRIAIALAVTAQEIAPNIFGVGENDRDEALEIILARGLRVLHRRTLLTGDREVRGVRPRLRQTNVRKRVDVAARSA